MEEAGRDSTKFPLDINQKNSHKPVNTFSRGPAMRKSGFTIFIVIFAVVTAFSFTGCGGSDDSDGTSTPTRFILPDLQGTWAVNGVNTDSLNSAFHGTISMANNGGIFNTSNYIGYPDYPSPLGLSGSLNISESGFLDGTIVTDSAFSFILDSGIMDISKNSIIFIDHTSFPREFDLAVLIKEGGAFLATDIQTTWHLFGLSTDSAASGTIYGDMTVNAAGTPSGSFFKAGAGAVGNISGGTISIDGSGYIPVMDTLRVGATTWTFAAGKLDMSKTFGVFTSSSGLETDMVVIIKTASLLITSDLAGTWYIHGATGGAAANGTIVGSIILTSSGAVTGGTISIPGELTRSITGGNFSLLANGTLSGFFDVNLLPSINIQSGRMDQSKKKIAFTDDTHERLYLLNK
jgi:hypothetical protein